MSFAINCLCGLLIFLNSVAFAGQIERNQEIVYVNSSNEKIIRWVLQEATINPRNHLHGRSLAVIEKKSNSLQKVIFRRFFSGRQNDDFDENYNYFSTLSDLKSKTSLYPLNQKQKIEREKNRDGIVVENRILNGYISSTSSRLGYLKQNLTPAKIRTEAQNAHYLDDDSIWPITQNAWTEADENDYMSWVGTKVEFDFLKGSGISVDCADFAITLRWIYAHDHGLPVANTLSGSGELFGQWSVDPDWQNLPTSSDWRKDEKFKAALRYVLLNTFTHTLIEDLYPTDITKQWVGPGSINLNLYDEESGHTQVIKFLGPSAVCGNRDCIRVLYGNVPPSDEVYDEHGWITNIRPGHGGFMRFRWPIETNGQWAFIAAEQMPGYSLNQYNYPQLNSSDFEIVIGGLLGFKITDIDRFQLITHTIIDSLRMREKITAIGNYYCHIKTCSPSSDDYENYSTPSRDARLSEMREQFLTLWNKIDHQDPTVSIIINNLNDQSSFGLVTTYYEIIFNDHIAKFNSDPRATLMDRWGEAPNSDNELKLNLGAWQSAWDQRFKLVNAAQELCYANNSPNLTCSGNEPGFSNLDTTRLDYGLRVQRDNIQSIYSGGTVSQPTKDLVLKWAGEFDANIEFCNWNVDSECRIADYLFSERSLLDSMESSPKGLYKRRFGF